MKKRNKRVQILDIANDDVIRNDDVTRDLDQNVDDLNFQNKTQEEIEPSRYKFS